MPDVNDSPEGVPVVVVFLAAGYGTRLNRDLKADPQFSHLADTPKPLLPLAGKPIIAHWLPRLSALSSLSSIIVITNAVHFHLYKAWAEAVPNQPGCDTLPSITVLCDESSSNATRLGAVKDLQIALTSAESTVPPLKHALVIAADTLLPSVDLSPYLASFAAGDHLLAVFSYRLNDMADSANRGMLEISKPIPDVMVATALVEKPSTPELAPSPWATAPIYLLHRSIWADISTFLTERKDAPLDKRDAPGHLLAWLIPRHACRVLSIPGRIDIGRLTHYRHALCIYAEPPLSPASRSPDEPAVGRAYPRIGLAGNPSDMYGGRVVALTISSEGFAEVVATPAETFSVSFNQKLELADNFPSLDAFVHQLSATGPRFGARQLVLAGALVFLRRVAAVRGDNGLKGYPTCCLSYSTTIPARIGLSGSSALILATWRALAQFIGMPLERVDSHFANWPPLLRGVESDELGITCGLMDRVAQLMQGVVSMDFSTDTPSYIRLPLEGLPPLFIVYYSSPGGGAACSGSVHAGTTTRKQAGGAAVRDIALQLASIAERTADLIQRRAESGGTGNHNDSEVLADLFQTNFRLRCELLGTEKVGVSNVKLVEVARELGFGAKMTGSGGCALCVPRVIHDLKDKKFEECRRAFEQHGMVLRKVVVLPGRAWNIQGERL